VYLEWENIFYYMTEAHASQNGKPGRPGASGKITTAASGICPEVGFESATNIAFGPAFIDTVVLTAKELSREEGLP
jgi:hypothetical protein